MWKYNQSTFRIESLSQSELSIQMAPEKRGLGIKLEVCVPRKWLQLPVAEKQQWNISNILSARTSV